MRRRSTRCRRRSTRTDQLRPNWRRHSRRRSARMTTGETRATGTDRCSYSLSTFLSLFVMFLAPLVCRRVRCLLRAVEARGEDLPRLQSSRRRRQHSRVRVGAAEAGGAVPRRAATTQHGAVEPAKPTRLRARARPAEADRPVEGAHRRTRREVEGGAEG